MYKKKLLKMFVIINIVIGVKLQKVLKLKLDFFFRVYACVLLVLLSVAAVNAFAASATAACSC